MLYNTDDLRIKAIRELSPPEQVRKEIPLTERATEITHETRLGIHRVLRGSDDRLITIVGPCSIHDPKAALDYAAQLKSEKDRWANELLVIMRVYFEKPRTTVGWKGLINDPYLDGTFQINDGLRIARRLLRDLNEIGVPAGVEYLDMISPQYIADLVSWGAVGARTTESQLHRELASGLSCPVGFKNGTEGNIRIAVDAIRTASYPHCFLSVTKAGHSAIVMTSGNEDCHVILRGGKKPNCDAVSVDAACKQLAASQLAQQVMIDFSHSNSEKDFRKQVEVGHGVAGQIGSGDNRIIGVMIESHLKEGRQDRVEGKELTYGQSITDGCVGWETTLEMLEELALAVRNRRVKIEAKD